ncbi:unnamed protein product [Cuscuta europaea]|uniref:Uncharacterized protein n=1 Tax=Cuscuta europaea TaxID=41803 RepID=A0A9P0ZXJ3_CUSEU|nr:unnamed protein product [Cuscuta europaea]
MIKTVLQTPFLETMSLLPKEAPRLDEPVGKGSHPLDQGGSHTCVNPFFGEVEGVGEGSPPLDQTVSHTYFNPLFGEDETVGEESPPLDQGSSHTSVNPLSGEDEVTLYTLLLITNVSVHRCFRLHCMCVP